MASQNDVTLIRRTRSAANALGLASTWSGNAQPVDLAVDFIYELYVLFKAVLDLMGTYRVDYQAGAGSNRNKFPQKPANKAGRPKFNISVPFGDG